MTELSPVPCLFVFILGCAFLLTNYKAYVVYKYSSHCSIWEAKLSVRKLCDSFKNDEIIGDFCSPLCFTDDITIENCIRHNDEEIKYLVRNSRTGDVYVLSSENNGVTSETEHKKLFNHAMFLSSGDSRIVKSIKSYNLLSNFDPSLTIPELRTVISLLRQNKFFKLMTSSKNVSIGNNVTLMTSLTNGKYFPDIAGTCGNYYVTEHVLPLTQSNSTRGNHHEVLQLAKKLDESGVHACDVTMSNVGVNRRGNAVMTNQNRVFTKEVLGVLFSAIPCVSDYDCTMLHCTGVCDVTSGYCNKYKFDSNVKVFQRTIISELSVDRDFQTICNNGICDDTRYLPKL
uniref:Uncharacterized LOC100186402 n=1 Tax=Ciona intestinalis TaxID=7719 RepID=A0A1W5BF98_CIOIN|nr:uncharacterized protein LOC100186402 [Ciona intestinalis]|eukprot:XP_002126726.1 uncharacterized protein LOC100186402 [Ciona intestinalis]